MLNYLIFEVEIYNKIYICQVFHIINLSDQLFLRKLLRFSELKLCE